MNNEFDTLNRFFNSAKASRKAGANVGEDDGGDDKSHRHEIHRALKAVHHAVFNSDKVKSLEDARQRHSVCVDLAKPDDAEVEKKDNK